MRILIAACALIALAACHKSPQPAASQNVPVASEAGGTGLDRSHKGQPFPNVQFTDPDGTMTSYAGLKGVPTLVNLWATWCIPCIKELPTLEKLGKEKKADLWVVPINQDMAPEASVRAFLKLHKLDIPEYRDPKMKVATALGAEVLPTSILFDSNGKEVWRYVGDLDWTSPKAAKILAEADTGQKAR
ncbi:MAG TPA: TlpA disulfide reductase family protein [Sphingomicrobium sp.]|nr:TlpA disulfide reductase family protein [Sphingomicrobium sp.]